MYTLSINMWFQKIMKQFFFGIDQVVYNFIADLYDLLISIARTSVLSQAQILEMTDRIYNLLAVFMIFKVTFSLITYVVNPDDFSDKSKGISKLGTNIIISLALLVLTPYLFNYAFRLQTIVLEDNSLAHLIFGDNDNCDENNDEKCTGDIINSAGDEIAFITMSAFFTPNVSLPEAMNCVELVDSYGMVNEECSGLDSTSYDYKLSQEKTFDTKTLAALTLKNKTSDNVYFKKNVLQNYVVGINNRNFGLMFRQDIAVATDPDNDNFIIDYKYIFSTVVGVVVVLLLITFCMDVGLRSIKLAFLQLIAPIPILSYVDPKSGKDGMFKKWYQMCFKTFLSLFVRLLVLYFAIYIIGVVANGHMVDIIDGTYQTNALVKIFIIIGALMFAKNFTKILEGLGIKLDGDGKFTLNPLKKFEDQAMGGKNITGLARGALVGTAGALTGAGIGRGLSGAWRGMTSGKGWKETGSAEAEMNRKMRQARMDGSTFTGRLGTKIAGATGIISSSEMIAREKNRIETEQKGYEDQIKSIEDAIAPTNRRIAEQKRFSDAVKAMETRAKEEIQNGNGGAIGVEYLRRKAEYERLKNDPNASAEQISAAEASMLDYLNNVGMKEYMTQAYGDEKFDRTFTNMKENAIKAASTIGVDFAKSDKPEDADKSIGQIIHDQFGASKGKTGELERGIFDQQQEIEAHKLEKARLGDELRDITDRERRAKADESVSK